MSTVNTGAPPAELRATIVIIHPSKPDICPDCGGKVELPCTCADGVADNVEAFRCSGKGHRIHAFRELAL